MSTTMVQLNTRIEKSLKQGGDSVFSRFGLSPSDVVRSVWRYAAEHQEPPKFMLEDKPNAGEPGRRRMLAREGRGLAVSLVERSGVRIDRSLLSDDREWSQQRDEMYADLDLEMEEACR